MRIGTRRQQACVPQDGISGDLRPLHYWLNAQADALGNVDRLDPANITGVATGSRKGSSAESFQASHAGDQRRPTDTHLQARGCSATIALTAPCAEVAMHTNVIVVRYPVGSSVRLVDADCNGRVKAIRIEGTTEYFVSWFDDDKRRCADWFTPDELRAVGVFA